jgi:hypothetical protein
MRRFDLRSLSEALLPTFAITGAVAWLWRCLCLFSAHGWNEIRLAPSFMWAHGVSPYPALDGGPATSWIYGPLPLALYLPATLASDAAGALLIAGAINLAVTLLAIAAVCGWWPMLHEPHMRRGRLIAGVACVALWPVASLEFLQADNAAVAIGLFALLCLQMSDSQKARWLAAAACAAAVACKQTLLTLAFAQCLYLALRGDLRTGIAHGLRIFVLTVVAFALAAAAFGVEGLKFNLLWLPARLPWTGSFTGRLVEVWPQLLAQAGLPLLLLVRLGRRAWHGDSPWLLPALAWASAWPLDLFSLFKNGGSTNSLHGALFFLPAAATLLAAQMTTTLRWRTGLATLVVAAFALRLANTEPGTWWPLREHLRQGDFLARNLPGEIYFPWHPLVTFYAEKRFDHIEDGLFMRYLVGQPIAGAAIAAHLPPRFHVVAFLRNEMDWGIARSLIPPATRSAEFGFWTLYSWLPQPSAGPPAPSPHS